MTSEPENHFSILQFINLTKYYLDLKLLYQEEFKDEDS